MVRRNLLCIVRRCLHQFNRDRTAEEFAEAQEKLIKKTMASSQSVDNMSGGAVVAAPAPPKSAGAVKSRGVESTDAYGGGTGGWRERIGRSLPCRGYRIRDDHRNT